MDNHSKQTGAELPQDTGKKERMRNASVIGICSLVVGYLGYAIAFSFLDNVLAQTVGFFSMWLGMSMGTFIMGKPKFGSSGALKLALSWFSIIIFGSIGAACPYLLLGLWDLPAWALAVISLFTVGPGLLLGFLNVGRVLKGLHQESSVTTEAVSSQTAGESSITEETPAPPAE